MGETALGDKSVYSVEGLTCTNCAGKFENNVNHQNITFSLAIKLIALLLVIPGWLTLWIAILADMGATLLVTLNSSRLIRVKE